jgi:indole-3-glycerol phosphate synthase
MIAEVPKKSVDEAASQLAHRARNLSKAGAHVLSVRTDADDTSSGLLDLFEVVRAVPEASVLRRDWFIHPLQVLLLRSFGRLHLGCRPGMFGLQFAH